MNSRFEKALHYVRELLVIGAMGSLIVLVLYVVPVLRHTVQVLDEVKSGVTDARQTARAVNAMVAHTDHNLNAEPFGVLPETKQLAKHAAATVKTIAQTSLSERARMDAQADKIDRILEHADGLVVKAGNDLDSLTTDSGKVLAALTTALNGLQPTEQEATEVLAAARELLEDPDIKRAILEVANSSRHVDEISGSLAKIADDAQHKFHQMLNPSKRDRIIGSIKTAVFFLYYLGTLVK